jgi:hypothetical protein
MELLTSFLTPSVVPPSPFSTPESVEMFRQLYKVAVKFVEKNKSRDSKKVKRGHDDIDSGQVSQLHPVVKSASSDIMVVSYMFQSLPDMGLFLLSKPDFTPKHAVRLQRPRR